VREIRAGVPVVGAGSADLIVEASEIDDEGARSPVPDGIAEEVAGVEGVRSVVGVVRAFARLVRNPGSAAEGSTFVPTVLASWDGGDGFRAVRGRAPEADDEIALTETAQDKLGASIGDELWIDGSGVPMQVVGVFELEGVRSRSNLGAVTLSAAREIAQKDGFTRLHVLLENGTDPGAVEAAIRERIPPAYRAVGVSQLGTLQQFDDELAIQQAFFDFLNPDGAIRAAAVEGAVNDETSRANYARFADTAAQATFRIQRFTFVDADHADVVYAIYYGSQRSPIVHDPQSGSAVRVDGRWKVASATRCAIANLTQPTCTDQPGGAPLPPAGWDAPSTQPGAVAAFRTMADPDATLEARVDAVVDGATRRSEVERGLERDRAYAGTVLFHVSGVRSAGADRVEVLYSLLADGDPPLDTPYPVIGVAVREDGVWRVNGQYVCGLRALAVQGC
jgi:hypothetical protein